MKVLPIGITTLQKIHDQGMVYVDKTGIIKSMAANGGYYFLSRPRRFGKSLLVDTFKQLFEGNEAIFRGLAIHTQWDWAKKYPVVKIDFAGGLLRSKEDFENKLLPVLDRIADEYGVSLTARGVANRLGELVQALYKTTGSPVVVLVDEYDKPLLDNIENPETAAQMRDLLKDFYSPIKELDSYLQFVFLTGVSKFSKVSIFSGINNLKDISLDSNYAVICGYTQKDLEKDFSEHLEGVDWEKLRLWYNGFNFSGEPVYNPFDILLFISENRTYRNFWFETGTPTFLVRLMQQNRYFLPDLENIELSDEQMASFDVEHIPPAVLLFQSGYLTIDKHFQRMGTLHYLLRVPNREVKIALSNALFTGYTNIWDRRIKHQTSGYDSLRIGDMIGLEAVIRRLFAGVPWRNFTNNPIVEYEGYWASVLYAFFVSITCEVIPEDTTNQGQADLTVKLAEVICVTEIKVIAGSGREELDDTRLAGKGGNTNSALDQIRTRDYAEKYLGQPGKRVFEVGMVFDPAVRNLSSFAWAERKA
jgi:hypothetical protein